MLSRQEGPALPVAITRRRGLKRLTLRLDRRGAGLRVSAPRHVSLKEIEAFVIQNTQWVEAQLAKTPTAIAFGDGAVIPLRDQPVTITAAGGVRGTVRLEDNRLLVPGAHEHLPRRVRDFLRTEARAALTTAVARYEAQLGQQARKLTLRDTVSRWGSCSADGRLNFSWRLIMAPDSVLTYVAAHEVAHLAYLDHSPDFWALCRQLYGAPIEPEQRWLRENGRRLFRIG